MILNEPLLGFINPSLKKHSLHSNDNILQLSFVENYDLDAIYTFAFVLNTRGQNKLHKKHHHLSWLVE